MELGGLVGSVLGLLMAVAGVALIVYYWRGRQAAPTGGTQPPTPPTAPDPGVSMLAADTDPAAQPVAGPRPWDTPPPRPVAPPTESQPVVPSATADERLERLQQLRAQHAADQAHDPIGVPPTSSRRFDPGFGGTTGGGHPSAPDPHRVLNSELLPPGAELPPDVPVYGGRPPRNTTFWRNAVAGQPVPTGPSPLRTLIGVVVTLALVIFLIGLLLRGINGVTRAAPGSSVLAVAEFGSGPAFTRDDAARQVSNGIRSETARGLDAGLMPVLAADRVTNATEAESERNQQRAGALLWGTLPQGATGPLSATLTTVSTMPTAPWMRDRAAGRLLHPATIPLADQSHVAAGPLIIALQAWQRYGAGAYDDARAQAENVHDDAPVATQNLAALIRADSLVALDQPQAAFDLYRALDQRGWHDPAILNNWGVAVQEAGDPTAAYGLFQRASAAQPTPPPAQLALILTNGGLAAEDRKDLAGAVAAYDAALKADPNNGPANLQRGYMAYRMGDSANAALYTARAAASLPDSPVVQRQLGLISLMQRKADAAIPYFQKALDTYTAWTTSLRQDEGAANSRNDSRAATRASALIRDINTEIGTTNYYIGLAYSDLARGKPQPGFLERAWRGLRNDPTEADRAIAAFEQAIKLDRDRPDVRYNMGRLYQQQGDNAKAREQYAQAKAQQPANPGPYEALAEMDLADKKPNDALAEYQALLAANPGYMTALIKMGDIYQAQGDKEGIQRTYGLVAGLPANTPQEHLWRAQALVALGWQDEAVAEGRAAVAGDPTLTDAHLLLANLYRDTKQDNAALAEYDAVLKLQPDNVVALYESGKLEAEHGNTEAARTLWQKVEQVKPDHPDVHFALAGLYEQRAAQATQAGNKTQGRQWLDQAINEYNLAIQQKAGSADALFHLGKLQEDKGDWKQAEARYAAAVKADPNQVEARQGLVRVLLKQPGRDDDALKAAQDFRKYAPNDARGPLLVGQVFLFRDDPNSALTQYQQALQLQPGSPEAYYGLGRAYQLRGDPTNAQVNYQAALKAQPGYPAALVGMGDLLIDGAQYGAAQEYYNQALQSDPNNAAAYVGLGRARDRLSVTDNKLAEEARKALQTAADLDPTAAEPHFYLGEFYAERALWGQAVTEYKRASSLRPSWAMPQFRLGQVYLSQKASAEALAAYQQATKLDPQMIEAWFGLGQAEREVPNRKEAINAYRQALKLKGDYAAAWLYLGYTLEEDGQRQDAIDAFKHALETATDDAQIRAAAQQALSRYQ